ncbi:MAG TPA: DinB family protein [Candidatus Limnocylindrales bacterium]|nr:DinB family protein [Candidatus Limnocylindrales bacterium]
MSDVIAQSLSMLRTSADRWSAIARVDASLLERAPAPGEWSALQALAHVVATELPVFRHRVLAIRAGEAFPGVDPDADGAVDHVTQTAGDLVARFTAARAESLATLESLTQDDLPLVGYHADLGPVTMAQLLNEWAAHDTMHIVQAERALMQAFIPGSGPWRMYFRDHDVEGG